MGRRVFTRWLTVTMAVIGALTVLGLVAFWPRGDAPDLGPRPGEYVDATITAAENSACPNPEAGGNEDDCRRYGAHLSSGPDEGNDIEFEVLQVQTDVPVLHDGEKVVLLDIATNPQPEFRYMFIDYQRSMPMLWLLAGFAVVVIAFGRFQGVRALAGLALSLAVLVTFVVPALLRDSPAVMVALVGTIAVAYIAIYLAHGVNLASSIALGGSLVALAITTVLALVVANLTQLSGLASEEAQTLRFTAEALDLRGLLIAGIVVGALGVLDDVTVSQVSTVAALRRVNPNMGVRNLYHEANRVGRDHVASTVNTLVLAYAGASLPLMLFFAQGNLPISRILTGELVAVEIVRMLVGSIGLVLAVPITTWLAATVLTHTEPDDLPDDHGHVHGHGHDFGRQPPVEEPEPALPRRWDDFTEPPSRRPNEPWF